MPVVAVALESAVDKALLPSPIKRGERSPISVVSLVEGGSHERSGLKKRDRALEPLPHEVRDVDEHALCKRLAAFTPAEAAEAVADDEPESFDSELAFMLGTGVALDEQARHCEAHQRRAMPYLC